jgi:hypothetical protein
MTLYSFKTCTETCKELDTACPNENCRSWIDYEEDLNCIDIALEKNGGPMTLRQVAKRMNYSFVRIKQLEDEAKEKFKEHLDKEYYL